MGASATNPRLPAASPVTSLIAISATAAATDASAVRRSGDTARNATRRGARRGSRATADARRGSPRRSARRPRSGAARSSRERRTTASRGGDERLEVRGERRPRRADPVERPEPEDVRQRRAGRASRTRGAPRPPSRGSSPGRAVCGTAGQRDRRPTPRASTTALIRERRVAAPSAASISDRVRRPRSPR